MAENDLKDFIETASSVSPFRVEDDFGGGYVRLRSEEAQRRQAIHDIRSSEDVVIEALRNSRDAHARTIFLATGKEGDLRRIAIIDDGDGIPPYMHERIFEPRVTSKLDSAHLDKWGVHGRGMALYSISVNCDEARVVASGAGLGAAFTFVANCASLGEKADQSTFPSFELDSSGVVHVRGPKNILRTVCEFAVDAAPDCTVYLGSPAEIAATLYGFGMATVSASMRAFYRDVDDLPLCKRLALAADPVSFRGIAEGLGLSMSERTCRRILDGQIEPVPPLVDRISITGAAAKQPRKPRRKPGVSGSDDRGLRLDGPDLEAFRDGVAKAFRELAASYYLDGSVTPEIRVGKDRLVVDIPVRKL